MTKKDEKGRIRLGDKMEAKDKKNKPINLIIFMASIIIILFGIMFYNHYLKTNDVLAKESEYNTSDLKISNASKINIDEIIQNNISYEREEYYTEEIELEYITKYQNNPQLPKGIVQVVQEGRSGKQSITRKKVYENGELKSEEQISSKVTKASVNKIVEIGTGNYKSSYKIKVGDIVYVTSDRLGVMVEPNENAEKIATLERDEQLKIVSIQNGWYQIISTNASGYVKAENTTYINKNETQNENNQTSGSGNKIASPSFEMALNKPSGLTLEQFKKILKDSKDTNKVFENNAEYFYYIEKQYNINGVFVAAVGIHESAWGTSKIANQKYNLFGYGAYDSNPYNGAYQFSDYSESIDLIARVFVKYYLNPKGTSIYGGEKATATYYNGPTLTGVNKKYATDKNWSNAVYSHIKYLYNKL